MAGITQTNGVGSTHGTHYSVAQLKAFEVDAVVSLATKGGIGSTIEAIVEEFQPLMYVSTGTAGKIFMICDGHGNTAASMTARLNALGTVDSINLAAGGGATVVERDLDALSAA